MPESYANDSSSGSQSKSISNSTVIPTMSPSTLPIHFNSTDQSNFTTYYPSEHPTPMPTLVGTVAPSPESTWEPSNLPPTDPSVYPTSLPSQYNTYEPTVHVSINQSSIGQTGSTNSMSTEAVILIVICSFLSAAIIVSVTAMYKSILMKKLRGRSIHANHQKGRKRKSSKENFGSVKDSQNVHESLEGKGKQIYFSNNKILDDYWRTVFLEEEEYTDSPFNDLPVKPSTKDTPCNKLEIKNSEKKGTSFSKKQHQENPIHIKTNSYDDDIYSISL